MLNEGKSRIAGKRELWFDKKFIFDLDNSKLSELLKRLDKAPQRMKEIVADIPEEKLVDKPGGRWSVKENIGHLIDLEGLHDTRINDFIEGRHILKAADVQNTKTEKANHNKTEINLLTDQFESVRENFIKRIENLDPEILNRVSLHPRLNQPMRIIDLVQFVAEHDDHHIETIKELIENSSVKF